MGIKCDRCASEYSESPFAQCSDCRQILCGSCGRAQGFKDIPNTGSFWDAVGNVILGTCPFCESEKKLSLLITGREVGSSTWRALE